MRLPFSVPSERLEHCSQDLQLINRSGVAAANDKFTKLRRAIRQALRAQGFHVSANAVSFRQRRDKRSIRKRHEHAVASRIQIAQPALEKLETELLDFIASGDEVDPACICPRLHHVEADTIESRLFKYACLHWSIPISEGYGRRLRFLVFDDSNRKLIGLIGLGDPVYSIKARDKWIGWDAKAKAQRLYHVMDAYVLGAVPPYSRLLRGKLVALAVVSNEIRLAFALRYANRQSLISEKTREPHLALVTTASALGRSSLYNRIRVGNRTVFESVGFTDGWGEFHFSDGVYERLTDCSAWRATYPRHWYQGPTGFERFSNRSLLEKQKAERCWRTCVVRPSPKFARSSNSLIGITPAWNRKLILDMTQG